jgi:hypothetical protein
MTHTKYHTVRPHRQFQYLIEQILEIEGTFITIKHMYMTDNIPGLLQELQ